MEKHRSTYQMIGWNRHGGGNDCGCHKEEEFHKTVCDRAKTEMQPDDCDCHRKEKLNYSPEQINALLKKVEEGADGLAIVDLKGKTAGDSIPRIPVQCIFSYDEKEVETIPFTRNGVTGTLVFVDIVEEGIENARLYYIAGRTILNIWPITDAPEWTKVWTKKQLEMIMELRDNLSLTTNR